MAINLLPHQEKRVLQLEIIQNRLAVFFFLIIFALFCLAGLFFVIRFFLSEKTNHVQAEVAQSEKEISGLDFQQFKKTIAQTNQKVAKINNFWQNQLSITPLLDQLAVLTPYSIYFSDLSLKNFANQSEIRVQGFAQTREALFFFKQLLDKEPSFKEAVFPPSAWVKPIEIKFSFSFNYAPGKE